MERLGSRLLGPFPTLRTEITLTFQIVLGLAYLVSAPLSVSDRSSEPQASERPLHIFLDTHENNLLSWFKT